MKIALRELQFTNAYISLQFSGSLAGNGANLVTASSKKNNSSLLASRRFPAMVPTTEKGSIAKVFGLEKRKTKL